MCCWLRSLSAICLGHGGRTVTIHMSGIPAGITNKLHWAGQLEYHRWPLQLESPGAPKGSSNRERKTPSPFASEFQKPLGTTSAYHPIHTLCTPSAQKETVKSFAICFLFFNLVLLSPPGPSSCIICMYVHAPV